MANSPSAMQKRLKRLHDEGTDADCTLLVKYHSFKVHKFVLFLHSDVLHTLAEKDSTKIQLKDVDPDHVKAIVRFMHYDTYEYPSPSSRDIYTYRRDPDEKEKLEYDVAMNVLGKKYNIMDLQDLSTKRFSANQDVSYQSKSFLNDFATVVIKAIEGGRISDEMRKLLVTSTASRYAKMRNLETNPLYEFLLQKPKFAEELAAHLASVNAGIEEAAEGWKTYHHCGEVVFVTRSFQYNCDEVHWACPSCGEKLNRQTWEGFEVKNGVSNAAKPSLGYDSD